MLRALMTARHIAENLLATRGGERRLTDILHISELLQEAASQLESEHALVRWLAQHIAEPDSNAASQQMRLESDKHRANCHYSQVKRAGIPLVWLPFIARFRKQDQAFYHDRETFAAVLDLGQDEASLELAEAERLAEDLRLLYVALTRAVWHCSLGVAPLSSRKSGNSDFHLSALGRLLQAGEAMDAAGWPRGWQTSVMAILHYRFRANWISPRGRLPRRPSRDCRHASCSAASPTTGG